jgi:hypothetical protein
MHPSSSRHARVAEVSDDRNTRRPDSLGRSTPIAKQRTSDGYRQCPGGLAPFAGRHEGPGSCMPLRSSRLPGEHSDVCRVGCADLAEIPSTSRDPVESSSAVFGHDVRPGPAVTRGGCAAMRMRSALTISSGVRSASGPGVRRSGSTGTGRVGGGVRHHMPANRKPSLQLPSMTAGRATASMGAIRSSARRTTPCCRSLAAN